jgi:fatty-acyl-CoA synthase
MTEADQVLAADPSDGLASENIFLPLLARAERAPASPFAFFLKGGEERTISQGWIIGAAGSVAKALDAHQVPRGSVVVIVLEHSPYLYAGFIGCVLSGRIPAILPPLTAKQDPDIFRASMEVLFARTQPAAILTSERAQAAVPDAAAKVVDIAALPTVDAAPPAAPPRSAWNVPSGGVAFLQHSSGTTSHRKGVMLSHEKVAIQISLYADAIGIGPRDVIASWLPLYHDMGLITSFLLPAIIGCPIVSIDALEWVARPAMLLDAIQSHRAAFTWLPNFAFHHLTRARASGADWDLSSMKAVINCSEPCRAGTFALFAEKFGPLGLGMEKLGVSYGMAETVFAVTQTAPGRPVRTGTHPQTAPYLSCGPALPGIEIRILGPDGEDATPGGLGEICLRHPSMFDGYWRLPEVTAERLIDGWYHTRDLGCLEDGELFVVGRVDDLIIVNGKNVMAHEIEDVVSLVEGVVPGRVIVCAEYDAALGGARMVVLVEPAEAVAEAAMLAEVRRAVFGACGVFPSAVRAVPRGFLVKSTSGKLSRAASYEKYKALSK